MKIIKTASGKKTIKLSKSEWESIGKTAGWIKSAEGWSVSDTGDAKRLGIIEFKSNDGEYHNFEVLELPDRLVFGGATNVGFLESGYILREEDESTDSLLQEMLSDLKTYYNDGPEYVSRIVVNERM